MKRSSSTAVRTPPPLTSISFQGALALAPDAKIRFLQDVIKEPKLFEQDSRWQRLLFDVVESEGLSGDRVKSLLNGLETVRLLVRHENGGGLKAFNSDVHPATTISSQALVLGTTPDHLFSISSFLRTNAGKPWVVFDGSFRLLDEENLRKSADLSKLISKGGQAAQKPDLDNWVEPLSPASGAQARSAVVAPLAPGMRVLGGAKRGLQRTSRESSSASRTQE